MKAKELEVIEEENVVYYDDIYSEENLDEMVDDDTISTAEYGFMRGYLKEQELEE